MFFTKVLIALATLALIQADSTRQEPDWWTSMVLYQIYPRSFKDSDGDGIGDLRGIIDTLDHVKDTGAAAVWLSPIFPSPMYDFGYDASDYTTIAEEYGTMEDWADLVAKGLEIGLKIVLDFVPNHTSHLHEWFIKSANREEGFEDYYIWHSGKPDPLNASNIIAPSNWRSVFRGSAWTWHEGRGQYYLHQFLPQQPDLNFRNPKVVEEMRNVIRYWLDRGAAGFRVDAIPHLMEVDVDENGQYPDEPLSGFTDDEDSYNYLTHLYTRDLDEMYDVIYDWRTVSDEYTTGDTRILMMEAMSSTELVMRYYGNGTVEGAHFPFNFNLAYLNQPSVQNIKDAIDDWFDHLPEGRVSNWVLGNHDQPRVASRYGPQLSEGIIMVEMLLPGVGITYQGEEIAMEDQFLSWEDTMDPQACNQGPDDYWRESRDPARTPFHWDDSPQAGFSTNASTWLPIADNYREVNLLNQIRTPWSHYHIYKEIIALRSHNTILSGDVDVKIVDANVLAYTRTLKDHPTFIVLLNMGNSAVKLNLNNYFVGLPERFIVQVPSRTSNRVQYQGVTVSDLDLTPYESLVLVSVLRVQPRIGRT